MTRKVIVFEEEDDWKEKILNIFNPAGFDVVITSNDAESEIELQNQQDDFVFICTLSEKKADQRIDLYSIAQNNPNCKGSIVLIYQLRNWLSYIKELQRMRIPADAFMNKKIRADGDVNLEREEYFSEELFLRLVQQYFGHDVFVVIPFVKQPYEQIYAYIDETSKKIGKLCKKADRSISGEDIIMSDIENGIDIANVVIAEISDLNPNVLFETGMSYALKKNVILIANEDAKNRIPDLLKRRRIIFYPSQIGGEVELTQQLEKRLQEIFENNQTVPPKAQMPLSSSCFVASSESKEGRDVYDSIIKPSLDTANIPHTYLWDDRFWQRQGSKKSKTQLIEDTLFQSRFFIADLSADVQLANNSETYDPSTFYLAGMAYMLSDIHCQFLYRENLKPPFDIQDLNLLRYLKEHEVEREHARETLGDVLKLWSVKNT